MPVHLSSFVSPADTHFYMYLMCMCSFSFVYVHSHFTVQLLQPTFEKFPRSGQAWSARIFFLHLHMYVHHLLTICFVCIHSCCLCTRLCNIGALFHLYMYIHHLQQVCTCLHLFVLVLALVCMVSLVFTCSCLVPLVFNMRHLFLFACTCLVCI